MDNAAAYLTAFCASHTLAKVGQCSQCTNLMSAPKALSPQLMLLYFKEYDLTMAQGLKWQCETVVDVQAQGTDIFEEEIDNHLHETGLYRKFSSLLNPNNLCGVCCPEHKDLAPKTFLHVLFMVTIHTKLREMNSSFKKSASTRHMCHALHQ